MPSTFWKRNKKLAFKYWGCPECKRKKLPSPILTENSTDSTDKIDVPEAYAIAYKTRKESQDPKIRLRDRSVKKGGPAYCFRGCGYKAKQINGLIYHENNFVCINKALK